MSGHVDVRVRYAETDQMGRVHHRNYLVWCELGRTSLMREHGISYAEMERSGILLPVTRVEVEYTGALFYDDLVRIETTVERVRSRDIVFLYRISRMEDGLVAAEARTTLVSADAAGRPKRLPPRIRATLDGLVDRGDER